jgi:hypothetical protein
MDQVSNCVSSLTRSPLVRNICEKVDDIAMEIALSSFQVSKRFLQIDFLKVLSFKLAVPSQF